MDYHWFDPRFAVFIIWGTFVFLFLCVPSKQFVRRICLLIGCRCGYEDEIAPTRDEGVSYEILSSARKQEMDSLRASHLTYRLHPFTLTLEKKHMLKRNSESESPNESPPQDKIQDSIEHCTCEDAEMELQRGIDPPERDEEEGNNDERDEKVENSEGEDLEYTHISVPEPGHNYDCVDVTNSPRTNPEDEKIPKEESKKTKLRLFGAKSKEEEKEIKEDPNTIELAERGKRRSCAVFCAICLGEYETGERVTWASNPDCTHVFHEDCVVQWLVSLGRTKSKMQRFCEEPSEAQLLNYELECPCCRQEFISRGQAELPDICGEESV